MNERELRRFTDKYIVSKTGCWEWVAQINHKGYGLFNIGRVPKRAHRISYEHWVGPIPDGMFVCHTCDNPGCCNPQHLFVGSASDNFNDCVAKGRVANVFFQRGEANHATKISEQDVLAIREGIANGIQQKDLAQKYGISKAAVTKIHFRRTWRHI